jgi:hypothetical protein
MSQNLLRASWTLLMASMLPIVLAGCGGGGKSCAGFTACGGNAVGNWKITGTCLSGNPEPDESCPEGTADASGLTITGNIMLNSDMTYSSQTTVGGSMKMTVPPSCLMQGGITVTCDQLQQVLQLSVADPESPFSAATCKSAGSNCACTFTFKSTPSTEQGTYATAGNVMTVTPSGGTPETQDYCVSGTKLQLKSPSMSMSMGGMMNMELTGILTLTKQ